jgi:hypothetical protein
MTTPRNRTAVGIMACLSSALGLALANSGPTVATTPSKARANPDVDRLFAAWSKPQGTPGCALGVLRDGKMLYSRAYGMADIEHDVPNTPSTVFHVARCRSSSLRWLSTCSRRKASSRWTIPYASIFPSCTISAGH